MGRGNNKRALVTGGCGFFGKHLIDKLKEVGFYVRVLDIVVGSQPDVEYIVGDLCNETVVLGACSEVDIIFHAASPPPLANNPALFQRVNVEGTRNLLECARKSHVKRFVFTSTASVVFGGTDIEDGSETLPYPARFPDSYSASKAAAEQLVLTANGSDNGEVGGLRTAAIRPHSIYGEGDVHSWPRLIDQARRGKMKFRLGNGQNLVDFTHVSNVVHAHILAADALSSVSSVARGQTYFITDGEPRNFWDQQYRIVNACGFPATPRFNIPVWAAFMIAYLLEFIAKIMCCFKMQPLLSRYVVALATTHHYYSIKKAQRELGYSPVITTEEGMEKTTKWYRENVVNAPPANHPSR